MSTVMLFTIVCNHAITVLSLRSLWFTTPEIGKMRSDVFVYCKNEGGSARLIPCKLQT